MVKPQSERRKSLLLNARVICSFGVVVVLIWLMIYNQVQLNEVTGRINSLNREITRLESEHTRMMSSLESTMSHRTIGDRAKNELGMNRREQYQTVHVNLKQEDQIEISGEKASGSTTVGTELKSAFTGLLDSMQEYIAE